MEVWDIDLLITCYIQLYKQLNIGEDSCEE